MVHTNQPIPLGVVDRAFLELESATVAGHTCKVLRLGSGAPDVDELRIRVSERLELTPPLTWRLGGSVQAPVWERDPAFEVAAHVVEHRDHRPVDVSGLVRCVARLFEQRLDRSRPLWRIDVVELTGGDRALVWRLHHALADGTTALRFARALLLDQTDQQAATGARAAARARADEARRRGHLAGYLRREFRRSRTRSPFDGVIGTRREIGLASVPLAPLHDAVKAIDGATLNDAALAIVAGALRHWLEARHGQLGTVRVKVPVSLHRPDDEAANHDSYFSFGLPLGEPDPIARLHAVHARTSRRKAAADAQRRELLLHKLGHVSPTLERFALEVERSPRRFALNVSNIPGPRHPVSVLSAPVLQLHSIAEISERHALRISIVSLADQLCFAFCADAELIPDVQELANRIEPEAIVLLDAVRYY